MSNQNDVDYEKQFREDLAKATALSLEQQALDEYNRSKKYEKARNYYEYSGAASASGSSSTRTKDELMNEYYAQLQQRQYARSSSINTHATIATGAATTTNEIIKRSNSEEPKATAAAATTTTSALAESDLINFNSPTSQKPAEHQTFEKLIEDLQKIQTTITPSNPIAVATALVPAVPTYHQHHLQQQVYYPQHHVNFGAVGMQVVPFQAPPPKTPLTNEQIKKLYNMPYGQQQQVSVQQTAMPPQPAIPMAVYGSAMGFVVPAGATSAAFMQPQYPRYPIAYNYATTLVRSQIPPTPPVPQPLSISSSSSSQQPQLPTSYATTTNSKHSKSSVVDSSSTASSANGFHSGAARRLSRATVGDDLIDLNQVDDSRVSVLEAFDPLLNEDEPGNDNASDCTSYYAEYDPFDYLYSGGGTQYSDPVYEAVNKFDKKNSYMSPNVASIGWAQEYQLPQQYQSSNNNNLDVNGASTSSVVSAILAPPPPLPPRNTHINNNNNNNNNHYSLSHNNNNIYKNNDNSNLYVQTLMAARAIGESDESTLVLDRRKFNAMPTCARLYEIVTDQRTIDPELLEFYYMVKELRSNYQFNDMSTNVGHIIAAEFNYHYAPETSIKVLVHPSKDALYADGQSAVPSTGQQFTDYAPPVIFTCDINTTVELVMTQAFCSLEGKIKASVGDYVVRPIGVSEWLSPNSRLSQLECVHNSLKLERDVQLGLCLRTTENMHLIARTQRDDMRDSDLRPEDILPNEMAATVSYDSMMILIETLETEIDKLESAVSGSNSRAIISCSGVVQGVKAICALLGSIDTLEIAACVAELRRVCDEGHMNMTASNLSVASAQGNPEILSDCGDYAEVCVRPRSTLENIKLKCNRLRDAVQELIELYSHVFRVGFSVKSVDYSATPIPISCVMKPIVVCVNCLHRPPPHWRFDDYSLGVQINYGTRFVSDPVVTRCSNDTSGGLFARLNFSSWLTFDKNPICTLPRESRMIFVLYGTQVAENEQPSNAQDGNAEKRQITTELGWCAVQLFDHKREMICGPYLLSMWPATADKFLGPAPARGCHPQPDYCPVLSIEIPPYGGRIQFPEPQAQPPPAPRYDFNSLDMNLQQELLDTAEQGYPGATDKREVFWEKRHYLQSFPYALPKVLHAAHSWDYASLIDLHALLHSWTALSPLQALELLLPRYPDAKVRAMAVEWIKQLPNDQLVDYLPQLLQALKHDTYEGSAMAKFLLCKCLESPRIAHHMYWLLVHSLPGDDPQNSIDASSVASELDDALIFQARYYRRNKLMLRALLAICGEKLLSRFLRQNMMCKSLAKIAENVKEAKESLRQKTLIYGVEGVHQELVDKPTSLPLGPELEVTGINVRNCSYFNSNTLPLKISYIGPDSEILPAIFKSGDDLQQDMLTIQLIRVMNKMWLAEGLDLKIVTFNCVPTGYKKGMIELVSDAETLRKIQVEYGLTGSFKDRPIAEWLAKQNPSQLEYQRAVKNFTVSCAGYSVATYILGICDRHNDNIMLKTSGHLFHIDFGKFLGDAQMFGNFKRDRTPFVLTSDMAYVINGGDKPSTDFHYFVDLCCRAFNIIRSHGDLILHMLALMATAGIPGVTADAVTYVRRALLPSQSNPEAAASFAKMIQFSLKSWFTQFNFFLHNLAQMRFTNDEGSGELLSFVPRKYTMQQDGRLKSVMVVRCQKHYDMEKYYTYILRVTRVGNPDPTHLFRSYKEFTEFHQKLCLHFPLAKLHSLPSGIHVGRSNVKSVAERRLPEIQRFLISLFNSADEIAHSDLVYTFFHPLLRDQQEAKLELPKVRETRPMIRESAYEVGQIKISLQYRRGALTVMIHHAKGLPMLPGGQEPNTYVKCYLKPDTTKVTKRKTKVVRKTCVPSFMETLEYRMPMEHIQNRILHVTVWSHDTLQENELLGGFQIDLGKYDLRQELIDWFQLGPMSRN